MTGKRLIEVAFPLELATRVYRSVTL